MEGIGSQSGRWRVTSTLTSDEVTLVRLPAEPPVLTPRLARALLRAITNVEAQRQTTAEAIDHTRQREALPS